MSCREAVRNLMVSNGGTLEGSHKHISLIVGVTPGRVGQTLSFMKRKGEIKELKKGTPITMSKYQLVQGELPLDTKVEELVLGVRVNLPPNALKLLGIASEVLGIDQDRYVTEAVTARLSGEMPEIVAKLLK
jgi:hypothetical protein